jgi:hypothetical protein
MLTNEVELKPPGPIQVKELTAVLVFAVRVVVWPAHIKPVLLAVTEHTKPQFVLPAPVAFPFA